mgnify:CR=1 FL=1|tara:strand:- start:718 stop:996 length:279 start_codon:yes stop_codon:yes gene_type:complete
MSEFKHNPNKGNLFKNKYKKEGSKEPDYKGTLAMPDGKQMELAGWINERTNEEGKKEKYFGLSLSEPYEKPAEEKEEPVAAAEPVKDDTLPF